MAAAGGGVSRGGVSGGGVSRRVKWQRGEANRKRRPRRPRSNPGEPTNGGRRGGRGLAGADTGPRAAERAPPPGPAAAAAAAAASRMEPPRPPAALLAAARRRRRDPPPPPPPEPGGGAGGCGTAPKVPFSCGSRGLPAGAEGWLPGLGEPLARREPASREAMLRVLDAGLERCLALHSAYIPVPRHRKLSGKAGIDEVMAATVLTSLSTSPLVLSHPPAAPASEPGSEVWKEAPAMSSSCSSSSNTSGDWSWDPPSDRSTPSTPSPPLSSHVPSTFLPTPLPDEGPDEPDGTHFVFGEPIPRKRKNSTKVMFKCLWKSCGKVLSSSSGMQKHIRTMHLGRKADLEQSDGEEDFYYTELDVDVDSLTDGLSSLTPVSPTSSVPPAFPGPEAQGPAPPALPSPDLALASPCSPPAPPGLCHVHTDHAYQGCPAPPRPPVPPTAPTPPPPKPPAVPRRPRGEAKKCRKVYGMENREMWCTACRWKKACQRFLD